MRKYLSEFGLGVYTSLKTMVPVEKLDEVDRSNAYHIYMILSRPRTTINPKSIHSSSKGITLKLLVHNQDEIEEHMVENFVVIPGADYSKVECRCSHYDEHLEIKYDIKDMLKVNNKIRNKKEKEYTDEEIVKIFEKPIILESDLILKEVLRRKLQSMKMEVLYIGQSYGKNGERTALDRLSSHSTLQKILIDCHSKYRDKRIYVLLLQFSSQLLSSSSN